MSTERELPTTWSGDPSKFEAVYREHAPRLRMFLRQLVGYPQAAEDLAQEIFTQLWLRPGRFDPTRGTLRAYLFGVARHRSVDRWRQTRPEDPLQEAKLTGQWTDHIPVMMGDNEYIDPSINELRVASPLLLRNDLVVGDIEGASSSTSSPKEAVVLYIPDEGRFIISLTQTSGSVAARIMMNRISFTSEGRSYVIVTGAPVARSETIWVKHDPSYKPSSYISNASLGVTSLSKL